MVILLSGPPGLFREGVAGLLGRFGEGVEVCEVNSLAAHASQGRAPDCVVMDGDDLSRDSNELEAARTHARAAPVVVLLSLAGRAEVGALIAAGVSGCIEKSASSGMLFDALRRALAGSVFLPESLRADRTDQRCELPAEPGAGARLSGTSAPMPNLRLTPRQIDVLALLARGRSNKVIARELEMAEATVKTHLSAIYKVLNVTSRGEASAVAARLESIRDAQVGNAVLGRISMEHLLADVDSQHFRPGEVLFRKGDPSGELFYLVRGTVLLSDIGIVLNAGAVLGEIGLFTPERRRTATAVCKTDCEMRIVGAADAVRLYYQDPEFAIYLIQLLASRLQADSSRRG
jgi:DNA-binding NarL/FixJ family response regulator